MANSAFSVQTPSIYGGGSGGGGGFFDNINPQGYMDILAFQDYGGASIFDLLQQPTPPPSLVVDPPLQPATAAPETSEFANTPTTNSSSISSSSNEINANDFDQENSIRSDDEQENLASNNKELKMKKKSPKKQKEPRFAFMTKTEVDHLDDGFRWRKYGQKAVKNSPFPRSYYRCTSASCGVKKRVERSSEDPSIVVTTYEGTHTHPCPITPRGIFPESATYGGLNVGGDISSFGLHQLQYQQPPPTFFHNQPNYSLSFNNNISTIVQSSYSSHYLQERQSCPSLFRDQGLLQDMLSFQIKKEEPKVEPS